MIDRQQKKCVVAATGFHLLLVLILLIGPAFLSSKSKPDITPPLDMIQGRLIDEAFSFGGNPNGQPPPPALPPAPKPVVPQPAPQPPPQVQLPQPKPQPQPQPQPEKVREPEPVKPTKNSLPDDTAFETTKAPVKSKIVLTPTVRTYDKKKKAKETDNNAEQRLAEQRLAEQRLAEQREAEQRVANQLMADRRRMAAEIIGSTARSLRTDLSPSTSLEEFGVGGGGPAYASYDREVQSIYWHAWIAPEDTTLDDAVTKVSVTIASDGHVVDSRITKSSGDASVDRSVRRALNRVTFIAPFPKGATDKERTYPINFSLKAKRLSG
jgi:TonB family protein